MWYVAADSQIIHTPLVPVGTGVLLSADITLDSQDSDGYTWTLSMLSSKMTVRTPVDMPWSAVTFEAYNSVGSPTYPPDATVFDQMFLILADGSNPSPPATWTAESESGPLGAKAKVVKDSFVDGEVGIVY